MNHLLAMAAAAALLVAPAAASAESIRISTAGKSPEQVHAEVLKAAETLCAKENGWLDLFTRNSCVRATVKSSLADSRFARLAMR